MLLKQDSNNYTTTQIDLLSSFTKTIPSSERRCINSLESASAQFQLSPLKNKRILLSSHMIKSTLILADLLLNAGVKLKITHAPDLVIDSDVLQLLNDKELFIDTTALAEPEYYDYFDLILDYGGYFANILKPRIAFIELTQTDLRQYNIVDSPIISVDASFIKCIETSLGVTESFSQSLNTVFTEKDIRIAKQNYVIIGYGKVGKAIAQSLLNNRVMKNQITIFEIRDKPYSEAIYDNFRTYNLVHQTKSAKAVLPYTDCVISATGVQDSLSRYFKLEDFTNVTNLINMGTHDEWGYAFPRERILNDKKPLNHTLEWPSNIYYLDPLFTFIVHLCAHSIIQTYEQHFKIIRPTKTIQKRILDLWLEDNRFIDSLKTLEKIAGKRFDLY